MIAYWQQSDRYGVSGIRNCQKTLTKQGIMAQIEAKPGQDLDPGRDERHRQAGAGICGLPLV